MSNPGLLRQQLKRVRREIPPRERRHAERCAIARVVRHPAFLKARRVAAYIGTNGELDPVEPLLPLLGRRELFLPVLHPFRHGQLWFCRWQPGEPLRPNRFGIAEPVPHHSRLLAARRLDLVIMPLLGFDADCHRLGMGGGYYDRTFAFIKRHPSITRPFLLGFAHELQRVEQLDVQAWDVSPDAVITNAHCYCR